MQASGSVNGWTRARNDEVSTSYAAGVQQGLFKHIVYSPAYLQQGSCHAGNASNCNVYQAPDLGTEPRIGIISNRKEIMRSVTNKNGMGVLTSPDMTTGPLIDPRMLADLAIMESASSYRSRSEAIESTSAMDQHHLEDHRALQPVVPVFARDEVRVSTRAVARQQCARTSSGAV